MGNDYEIVDLGEKSAYYYLHNCYPCNILYKGLTYQCLQSAYEAQKESNKIHKLKYINVDGYTAMILSTNLNTVLDDKIFYRLLKIKFENTELREKLLSTKNAKIIYYNTWHDCTFGICTCEKCNSIGDNKLGGYLMRLRGELLEEEKS